MKLLIAALLLVTAACGGGTSNAPTAPAAPPLPAAPLRSVSGTVHAIDGSPLGGVQIETATHSTVTDASGTFAFSITVNEYAMSLTRTDYEPRQLFLTRDDTAAKVDVAMQPLVVLPEGTTLASFISPDDFPYYVGEPYDSDWCGPCKIVHVRMSGALVKLTLRWSGGPPLQLWAGGVSAEPSGASEQTIVVGPAARDTVYVGLPMQAGKPQVLNGRIAFELSATTADSAPQ